ncbi:DNA N6-methyl adenine demethylase-like [Vespula maculifrons]|uniref:DNA N6-methyl adenine demethylase-like n=1 Tax=Vespula maculifrons TaxID=7453 RepID=A0ABD2BX31_VESMC
MKLRRRCMQTLGVSVKQLRRKLFELGARILHAQGSKPRDMALVMLSMGSALDVRRGGREGGEVGGGGGGRRDGGGGEATNGNALARGVRIAAAAVRGQGDVLQQEAMVAAARDRAIRTGSVRQDLALNLPPRLELPDGEERPYGAQTNLHLRDPLQESEIYQKCIRPPPNRTIFDSESPPPYRSQSALLEPPEQIVRCHSAGSSLLKMFRKFPSSASSSTSSSSAVGAPTPPKKSTLSSYSESSSNLSNLSTLTVVPCETDESQQEQHHHRQKRV